jgi:hypothetical protein
MLHDIADSADKWGNNGKNGRIDPFTEVYHVSFFASWFFRDLCRVCVLQLVFIMNARMTTCHDLTKNEADLKKISELFATLQNSATPVSLLLPWFPSSARKTGRQASTDMYTIIRTYVENRRHAEPTSDAIDMLIADGGTTQTIIEASPGSEVARDFLNSDSKFEVHHVGAFRRCHQYWYHLYASTTGVIDDS